MNNKKKPTVYRPRSKSRKAGFASSNAVIPTIVTIAAAGLICVFGYSIAKPIVNGGGNENLPVSGEISDATEESKDAASTTTTKDKDNETAENKTTTTTEKTKVVLINGETTTTTTKKSSGGSGIDVYPTEGNDENGNGSSSGNSGDSGNGDNSSNQGGGTSGGNSSNQGGGTSSGSDNSNGGGTSGGDSSGNGGSSGNTGNTGNSGTANGAPEPVADVYPTVQCSVRLPQSAVSDANTLRTMLKNVKTQYPDAGAVVIPMKLSGGALNYASSAAGDAAWAVCQGSMTAVEIASIVREEGFYAYASCSLLDDNLYPTVYTYRDASYMIEKDGVMTGDQWLDNYADKGGKPWLNPESSTTTAYLEGLVQELSSGGFSAILCSGFTYPNFRPADEKYLSPEVYAKNPDSMIELANMLSAAVPDTTDIVLDLSAYYAMNGWELVYQPEKLDVSYALLNTSSADASSAASWAQNNKGDMNISLSYSDGSGSGHRVITY